MRRTAANGANDGDTQMSCLASGILITASGQHLLKCGTYSNLYSGHSQFTCDLTHSQTHRVTRQRHQKQLYLSYFIRTFLHAFFLLFLFIYSVCLIKCNVLKLILGALLIFCFIFCFQFYRLVTPWMCRGESLSAETNASCQVIRR